MNTIINRFNILEKCYYEMLDLALELESIMIKLMDLSCMFESSDVIVLFQNLVDSLYFELDELRAELDELKMLIEKNNLNSKMKKSTCNI